MPDTHPRAIPTNIITGFLGSGKTTVIQHLLAQKPASERWAVLVNEFGEIGIDGALLNGVSAGSAEEKQVFIREVPGGCMCCTSGLPMQIAMNQLITRAKPHRLIIEPTGLGHPKEVLAELSAPHNREYIALQSVITLIDARKIVVPRYHTHDIYRQQIDVASVLVASKSDLYDHAQINAMKSKLSELGHQTTPLAIIQHGKLDVSWLQGCYQPEGSLPHLHRHDTANTTPAWQAQFNEEGVAKTENQREGFNTQGWIYSSDYIFDFSQIVDLLTEISAERLKGVFITERGIFGFNKSEEVLSCVEVDESDDSRLEIIAADTTARQQDNSNIEQLLLQSVKTRLA